MPAAAESLKDSVTDKSFNDFTLNKNTKESLIVSQYITINSQEAKIIARKIWMNETSGDPKNLTVWHEGESFMSLGIGHFIWYPHQAEKKFQESFPELLKFLQEKGINVPFWLEASPFCPWNTREEFLNNQQSDMIIDLQNLLANTMVQQAQFMIRRLEQSMPEMLKILPTESQRKHIAKQFYRVANSPGGTYALIDYINFKGEGTLLTERYRDQGWGLLQVLEQMPGSSTNAKDEFADAAKFVLRRRVQNSPKEFNEKRWLKGWLNRIDTYR